MSLGNRLDRSEQGQSFVGAGENGRCDPSGDQLSDPYGDAPGGGGMKSLSMTPKTGHSRSAGARTKADQASTSGDRTNTSWGDSKVRPR